MRRHLGGALFSALLAISAASPAAAGDAEGAAREAFDAGDAALRRRDYRAAGAAYDEAFRLSPNGTAAYNAALAWRAAGDREREADALALAIATPGLPGSRSDEARTRLRELRRSLAALFIEAPPGFHVTVRKDERRELPARLHVMPGEHELIVESASGALERRRISATAGETLHIVLGPEPVSVGAAASAPKAPVVPRPVEPVAAGSADPGATPRTIGWIGVGVGVACGIAAGATGIATLRAYARANETLTDADVGTFHTLRDTTNGLAIGAAAAGAVGLVLLLAAPSRPAKAAPRAAGVDLCGSPGGAALCGRF